MTNIKSIKIRVSGIKQFFRGGRGKGTYHLPYHTRGKSTFCNTLPVNQGTLINIFSYLHDYASHGVKSMYKRWKPAERRFEQRHMPYVWGRSTCRFVNKYTAHRWI